MLRGFPCAWPEKYHGFLCAKPCLVILLTLVPCQKMMNTILDPLGSVENTVYLPKFTIKINQMPGTCMDSKGIRFTSPSCFAFQVKKTRKPLTLGSLKTKEFRCMNGILKPAYRGMVQKHVSDRIRVSRYEICPLVTSNLVIFELAVIRCWSSSLAAMGAGAPEILRTAAANYI